MTLRTGLILILPVIFTCCSDNSADDGTNKPAATSGNNISSNPVSEEYATVCGLFFTVDDFNIWQQTYLEVAQNTIAYLRNEDDPSMVAVFESNKTLKNAKTRVEYLIGDEFSQSAGVKGTPVVDYYDVIYYKPSKPDDTHFLALSFRIKDIDELDLFGKTKFDQFSKLGLRPVGLGSNPIKADDVYMLFTVKDIELIREKSNTAGKLSQFLRGLNLPVNANMSYWAKP